MFNLKELDEERQKWTTGDFRKGYGVFKGCTMPENFRFIEKQIEEFEVYDDDIWITSFPKAGTTWTQEMVWCILHDLDFETTKKAIDIRMPFLEFCCMFSLEGQGVDYSKYDIGYLSKSVEFARDAKRPRILKTHLPFHLLPKQIQNFERNPKIIHVYRNMKDTCVSYYHHQQLGAGFRGDFDLFWKLFITGKLTYTPMIDTIQSYWQHRDRANFLFIRFEDMKAELRGVVLCVCAFLNKSFPENEIKQLENHLSFESMKQNPFLDKRRTLEFCKAIGSCVNTAGKFYRQGKTGGYKGDMNQEVEAVFDDYLKSHLVDTDLRL